ncbi:NUC153 domain-containing protein [Microdochium nivale]|nr:NUC153 domain-containing protein [Microdochium nivale]
MPKPTKAKSATQASAPVNDDRFASFENNPRYKLPSKQRSKTTVDKRFARMLKDDDFTATAKVDKYGRKLKSDNKKKALQRLYKDEDAEEDEGDEDVEKDDVVERELERTNRSYDPARGGGFYSSESESDSDGDDEQTEEPEVNTSASVNRLRDAQADVETGDVTRRIAIVNLDWDHIKSSDLMALFSSFAPKDGRIERVSVYPSEFGKERMQREELEGPPREIFKKNQDSDDESEPEPESEIDSDEDEDEKIRNEIIEEGDDQDFDSDALRSYQLDRLRYYYAVMVCSDPATAEKIYQATDGTEYQTSSNFIDLRFVPDEVDFGDEPRDECREMPSDYKPTEFVTDALQHSKVKLTWDMHPEEVARKEDIKRAFTGSRADLEENDLKAYLASDSEDEVEPQGNDGGDDEEQAGLSKKELKAQRMRAMLGLGAESSGKSSKSAPVGGMEITFTPGLMDDGSSKKKKADPEVEETTIEKYKRKEKERKSRKKELAVQKRTGDEEAEAEEGVAEEDGAGDDLGFDDPFFTTDGPSKPITKTSQRKEERLKKQEAKATQSAENAAQRQKLERIMAEERDENDEHLDHFNIKEIARAEKLRGKKSKKAKKAAAAVGNGDGLQDGFKMDVADDRFGAVFGDHKFAIDPSHPQYKATPGMKQLLEEGRKKRKNDEHDAPAEVVRDEDRSLKKKKQKTAGEANDDLASLVESVRRKANSKK